MAHEDKDINETYTFEVGERVVHPKHGVCQVMARQAIEVCGLKQDFFILEFPKGEKLSVPVAGAVSRVGVRKLADSSTFSSAMEVLKKKPRVRRTVWPKRSAFYDSKMNSGDLLALAEVLCELYQPPNKTEKSYSEKQLYMQAMERMSREVAAAHNITQQEATVRLESLMQQAHGVKLSESEDDHQTMPVMDDEILGELA